MAIPSVRHIGLMRAFQAAMLVAVVIVVGCSEGESRTGMVSGKVTLDDAPVSAGTVVFMNDEAHGDAAELKPDGAYSLQLQPGSYKVSVSPPSELDPMGDAGAGESDSSKAIPKKYHDFSTSDLSADVGDGDSTVDFALTR